MAMFMTSNHLTADDVRRRGEKLDFPDSVRSLMRGDLGQIEGGFDKEVQAKVLKGEVPYTDRPNAHLEPIDFEQVAAEYREQFDEEPSMMDLLSQQLYPKVFAEYKEFQQEYGQVANLPTPAFFYGLKPNGEEILVRLIAEGKRHYDQVLLFIVTECRRQLGNPQWSALSLNGQTRRVRINGPQKCPGDSKVSQPKDRKNE